jgi:cohesin loading factor subunit SCC2
MDNRRDSALPHQTARPEAERWTVQVLVLNSQIEDMPEPFPYFRRLRDGRSIHTVSALLLQLVQTSAHDVRIEAKRFARRRRELVAQSSLANLNDAKEELLTVLDREVFKFRHAGLLYPLN